MLQTLLHQNVFLYGIVGVGVAGVLLKLLLHSRYRRLLFAAENMSLTDQKMFKNLRGKFEDTYMKNMKINHMTSFIHKNLYRQKFLGVTYSFWNHMNQQILLLIAAVAAAGSLYLWTGGMDSEVWKLLCAAAITASVVQMTELWIGNPELWDMIHTNLDFSSPISCRTNTNRNAPMKREEALPTIWIISNPASARSPARGRTGTAG